MSDVLIKPLVTEKLTELMEAGHYAFEVRKDANKVSTPTPLHSCYPGALSTEVCYMQLRCDRLSKHAPLGQY